eukprot:m.235339 g.235339  ORF g.235339 m.235339 type:complete len:303 (-) comp18925_c0_seq2:138-1046(-)
MADGDIFELVHQASLDRLEGQRSPGPLEGGDLRMSTDALGHAFLQDSCQRIDKMLSHAPSISTKKRARTSVSFRTLADADADLPLESHPLVRTSTLGEESLRQTYGAERSSSFRSRCATNTSMRSRANTGSRDHLNELRPSAAEPAPAAEPPNDPPPMLPTDVSTHQLLTQSGIASAPASAPALRDVDLATLQKELSIYPWYIGAKSRVQAEALLESKPEGTCVVRTSKAQGVHVLTIKAPHNDYNHILIQCDPETHQFSVSDEEEFESIPDILNFYTAHWEDFSTRMWTQPSTRLITYTPD